MSQTNILHRIRTLRRRHLRLALYAGMAIAVIVLVAGIALCMWVDLVMELVPALRIGAAAAIVIGCLIAIARPYALAAARLTRQQLAREFDQAGGHAGQILSGSDLAETGANDQASAELTQALAVLSVELASGLADHVPIGQAAPATSVRRWLMGAASMLVVAGLVTLVAPRLIKMQWARIIDPFGDHPPFSRVELTVTPGNTSAIYGQGVDISVSASQDLESAEMVWQPRGAAAQTLPMFRETTGKWRGTIAEAREPGEYFIRTPVARSYRYKIDMVMVPQVSDVHFRITPPAYTRKPTYDGPVPQDGITGLPGTKVEVLASSNRPLVAGTLEIPTLPSRANTQPTNRISLAPVTAKATQVRGEFEIAEPGKLAIQVQDTDGRWSTEAFTAQIKVIKDARPLVRLLQPQPLSLATPSALLALQASAEDDYGITRLEVFRSLNGSRPRGSEFQVPMPAATRTEGAAILKLAEFKLQPGDMLEFFARAEDNDPAGAKGSETPVTVVKIISEEQMRELEIAQAGMETLQGKYQQAERLMEALQQQIAAIDKQIKQNGESSAEAQKQLQKAKDAIAETLEQLDKLQQDELPLALDKALRKELSDLKDQVNKTGDALKQANPATPGSTASAVSRALDILGQAKQQYEKNAMEPLDRFEKVYALKEDEAKFVELYNRQKDLADRLAALKSQPAVEDPSAKARMRDLEDQQREIRDDLDYLLQQIETHTAQLPEDDTFAKLRKTAQAFVEKARASGAARTMAEGELAMSSFNGQDGWKSANDAAKILYSLLGHCNATGDEASQCPLKFAPNLSESINQTIEEMLAGQGMKSGRSGIGQGGYSAQRNTMQNVGLYGSRPRTSRPQQGRGVSGTGSMVLTESQTSDGNAGAPKTGAAGQGQSASQVPIPSEYRRRVGDYYQRVADELGDTKPANGKTRR